MITTIVISGFLVAGLAAGVRLLRGPSLADRIIALDVALLSLMGGIAALAADQRDGTFLSLLIVIAIIGFTATVAASRFIEHEASRP